MFMGVSPIRILLFVLATSIVLWSPVPSVSLKPSRSTAAARDLAREAPAHGSPYAPRRKLAELLLKLRPHKETTQFLGCHRRGPRTTERVEDEVSLPTRSEQGTPHEPEGFLGRVVAVELLVLGNGTNAPDARELLARVRAVYEVVVEGVARSFARPDQGFVRVGERRMQSVGRRVRLEPGNVVDDLEPQPLEREAYAEDDVVRTAHPQRAVGLENSPGRAQPPDVEVVILLQSHRANRVTILGLALPGAAGRQRPRTRSP